MINSRFVDVKVAAEYCMSHKRMMGERQYFRDESEACVSFSYGACQIELYFDSLINR